MQLLCSYINVAGKNVIGNYILKKSSLIVLFLVIHLRLVKGDGGHHARHARHIVAALNKNGIVKLAAVIAEHLIGTHAAYKHRLRKVVIHARKIIKPRTDHGQLTACDDKALIINDADAAVGSFLYLYYHALKNSAGHRLFTSSEVYGYFNDR